MNSQNNQIKFHHISIIVKSNTIKDLLFAFFDELKENTLSFNLENVELTLLPLGGAYLELVHPHGNERMEKFLEERGEAIHHFCFEVNDLDYWLGRCEKIGFRIYHNDDRCFFIHPDSLGGILLEFIRFFKDDPMKSSSLLQN
jgi:hypothetical protein